MMTNSYHELQTTETISTKTFLTQIKSWLLSACNAASQILLSDQTDEPSIRQLKGRTGEVLWEIYDPSTDRSCYCTTENEIMEHLDNFYLQYRC
jgi:hypothetical protein